MRLHPPPGRAGRLWLLRRLAVAERGHDVLEQKRRALLRRLERLEKQLAEARREWEEEARAAELWWQRAAVLGGERPLELACEAVPPQADVHLVWRNSLGVVHPAEVETELPPADLVPGGGTAALALAVDAHRRALAAAARFGALRCARDRTVWELTLTATRLRAIERRWVPAHREALATLQLALDENDREDATRVRWFVGRRDGAAPGQ